ncbi:RHS repeat-associated core domain-containing protein [Ornatilinea apprima]|uniref:RHS repeat-associated core domain-containing protein n=1 Tax=Ornatilinea apprima TaxID=1134406 RepID=UPI0013649097|nr:RHS repeat-associated core domain-containing protein [Ornatilinea apprima]
MNIDSDHLGSASVTANVDGSLNSELRYTAFGEVRYNNGLTPTDYRYTGQLEQAELGLYYYVARWYDPCIIQFNQPDTLVPSPGKAVSWNRYAYADWNPIIITDPTGHFGVASGVIGVAIGGMAGAIGYFSMNYRTFDSNEYWTAVAASAIAGGLIGSGLAIAASTETTVALSVAASAMIGSGTSAAMSEMTYIFSNKDKFESKPFVQNAAIEGVVGGITAICPNSSLGVAAKGVTYIAGAETQYALDNPDWTTEGAINAAILGAGGYISDISASKFIDSTFITTGYLPEKVWPGRTYSTSNPILKEAALSRGRIGVANSLGNITSGLFSSITLSWAKALRNIDHYGN